MGFIRHLPSMSLLILFTKPQIIFINSKLMIRKYQNLHIYKVIIYFHNNFLHQVAVKSPLIAAPVAYAPHAFAAPAYTAAYHAPVVAAPAYHSPLAYSAPLAHTYIH